MPMHPPRRSGTILFATAVGTALALAATLATPAAAKPKCFGRAATIEGSARGEVIRGTPRADVIVARGGHDTVIGGGGHDVVCGNSGNDKLVGVLRRTDPVPSVPHATDAVGHHVLGPSADRQRYGQRGTMRYQWMSSVPPDTSVNLPAMRVQRTNRRHLSHRPHPLLPHPLRLALAVALALSAILTALPVAAQDVRVNQNDLWQRWQLLTYRTADGKIEPVPAGVGATLLLFADTARGEAACSTYVADFSWTRRGDLFIDAPRVDTVACDPTSQAFDEVFYRNLNDARSVVVSDSILTVRDSIGDELMTLTRAVIDDDPTVARWDLARIGAADGSIEPVIQGLDPWIEFLRGGRVVGSTGCGSFLGAYAVNDGTIDVSDVHYRLGTCTEGARAQAEKVIATLTEITDFEVLPAGLALRDQAGITRLALTPDLDLARRSWTPTVVYDRNGNVAWDAQRLSTSTVKFDGPKTEGRTICRPFTGKGLRTGLALNVFGLDYQGDPCRKPKRAEAFDPTPVEAAFIDALEAAASHALRGSELELKDVDGNTLMRLLPEAEFVGPTWIVKWMGTNQKPPVGESVITATFDDIGLVQGETGAAFRGEENLYFANYATPTASRIAIDSPLIDPQCPPKNKTPLCQQERKYIQLLTQADGYKARDTELKLFKGSADIMAFEREVTGGSAE